MSDKGGGLPPPFYVAWTEIGKFDACDGDEDGEDKPGYFGYYSYVQCGAVYRLLHGELAAADVSGF